MNSKIQTFSGLWFDPRYAEPKDILIEDIAHSLSLLCRFMGHCRCFYSVAQHSVIVSEILEAKGYSKEIILGGLLHDAHEAYLSDMVSPVKKIFPEYQIISETIQNLIDNKFGHPLLTDEDYKAIKEADMSCFNAEVRDLLLHQEGWQWLKEVSPYEKTIIPLYPEKAEKKFLERFWRLYSARFQ